MRSLKKFRSVKNQRFAIQDKADFTVINVRPKKFTCLSFTDPIINKICTGIPDPSLRYVDYRRKTPVLPQQWDNLNTDLSQTPGLNIKLLHYSIKEYFNRSEIDYEHLRSVFLNYRFASRVLELNPKSNLFSIYNEEDLFTHKSGMDCILDIHQQQLFIRHSMRQDFPEEQQPDSSFDYFFDQPNVSKSLISQLIFQIYSSGVSHNVILKLFHRSKLALSPTLLSNWFRQIAQYLEPLYTRMRMLIQSTDYVQIYNRTFPVRKINREGEFVGDLWLFFTPQYNFPFFSFQKEYYVSGLYTILGGAIQFVQTQNRDYGNVFEELPKHSFLGCWNEVRSVLLSSKHQDEERCNNLLKLIDGLYAAESQLILWGASENQRIRFRKYDSYLKVREIEACISSYKKEMPLNHPLIPVWEFIDIRIEQLARFTKRSDFKIDTSNMDKVLDSLKILHDKNAIGARSVNDCFTTMILCTLIGGCVSNDIDMIDWFQYVLKNKHLYEDNMDELLPFNWKKK